MEPIATTQKPKRNVISSLVAFINRPMLALSVLIHVGLMSIPLPEPAEPVQEEVSEDSAAIDLSQLTLAESPLTEVTPLDLPSVEPSPDVEPTIAIDTSRAPRPPRKAAPTPTVTSIPKSTPVPTPTPSDEAVIETPSETPPTADLTPQAPVVTRPPATPAPPPPPPVEVTDSTGGLSREEVRVQFAEFRLQLRESDSDKLYPALLDQPGAFFRGDLANEETVSQDACLDPMIYCWWQPLETPRNMLRLLREQEFLANLEFQTISEGYGTGDLYQLISKSTGQPTTYYVTLTKPKGATATGTMVGFWTINPRDLLIE